jgi:hypothetical protein
MRPLEGRLELKLFAEENGLPAPRELVSVFHGWIQTRRLPGELLIDVADYSHVHHGPGVLLVGHRATYGMDRTDGRPGLLCRLRQPSPGDTRSRLRDLFRRALQAAVLLGEEPSLGGRFRVRNDELRLRIHDRRCAPNEASTWSAVAPELSSFFTALYRTRVRLAPCAHAPEPFAIRVEIDRAPDPIEVLQAISALQ